VGAVSVVKTKHLLREFLLRDSSITDLVGQAVYTAHLSDADAGTVLKLNPIIIIDFMSGNLRWYGAVEVQSAEFYAYSKKSSIDASKVYDAMANLLQHERLIVAGIDLAACTREVERPIDGYAKHLDAWWIRGRWLIEGV
jgi:hypothetical protein